MTITALTFTLACVCTQLWPTGFTIWSLVIALFMGESYIYPLDVRYSANRSNQLWSSLSRLVWLLFAIFVSAAHLYSRNDSGNYQSPDRTQVRVIPGRRCSVVLTLAVLSQSLSSDLWYQVGCALTFSGSSAFASWAHSVVFLRKPNRDDDVRSFSGYCYRIYMNLSPNS